MSNKNQRQLVQRTYFVTAMFGLAVVVICGLSISMVLDAIQGERKEPVAVLDDATVQTFVELKGERAYPESITIGSDGNIYSGSFCTGEIWQITPDGELSTWVKSGIKSVSGMVFDSAGTLYVVDHGDCNPRNTESSIKKVAPDGKVTDFVAGNNDTILNSLTFDTEGRLYVTDTQSGHVMVYDMDGNGETWWELPRNPKEPQPTGITFDANNNALIIADSGNGTLFQVSIAEDGSVGDVLRLYVDDIRTLDGLTLDDQGRIIFTLYDKNEVVRRNTDGTLEVLAEDFRNPSDVAFLDNRVYVTNFDGVSLAPVVSVLIDPSLPFTIDVIQLPLESN